MCGKGIQQVLHLALGRVPQYQQSALTMPPHALSGTSKLELAGAGCAAAAVPVARFPGPVALPWLPGRIACHFFVSTLGEI